ncbi:MAG TPA: hypothetical protein VMW04_01650 [Patescibacteria group bacterium]|nr:hypothetical protein [Patescibacteria group bacterium]
MKKIGVITVLLVAVIVLAVFSLKKISGRGGATSAEPTPIPARPIEESIKERPFVSLLPTTDGHWVTLEVKNLPKGTSGIEYDLIYLAEVEESKIERGVTTGGQPIELNGAVEYTKKMLFGSASCTTGVCKYKYDENVTEGTLMIKVIGAQTVKYETAYRLQRGEEAKTDGFSTGDGNFRLTAASLPAKTLYLTTSTIGVPVPLPAEVTAKSVPYGVFPSIAGKAEVTFKTDLAEATIYAYNGRSWQKLSTTVSNGEAVAAASSASIFILTQ